MNSLYLLSFLLTANGEKAEQCFVSGLEDCSGANGVFKEWARSWARRTIIQNAVRMMQPTYEYRGLVPSHPVLAATAADDRLAPFSFVLGMKTFERFVFVMSVLERYADHDCAAVLGCSRQDVVRARVRALEGMHPDPSHLSSSAKFDMGALFAQAALHIKTA